MHNMTFKDRTSEFNSIAEFMVEKHKIRPIEKKQTRAEVVKHTITVNKRASEICRKTSATATKLKELTELAKSRSPFGDLPAKIELLTETITQDINTIKLEIEDLERFVSRNSGNKQSSDHSVTVIHALTTRLLNTNKELEYALQIRTQIMKSEDESRNKYTGGHRPGPAPKLRPSFKMIEDEAEPGDEVVISMQTEGWMEENLIVHRNNAVRDIEAHITEVRTIFQKLSVLVEEQREKIQRIDDNIGETIIHADSALEELLKYLKGMSSDRWLIIKAFMIVIFCLFVWFMFFA